MICNGDISKIFNENIDNYVIGAVLDTGIYGCYIRTICEKHNLQRDKYFNSGMLYINVSMWNKYDMTKQCLLKVNDGGVYTLVDQDCLNILLAGKVKYIPNTYNHMVTLDHINCFDLNTDDIVIFHYITQNKPWFKFYMNKLYQYYLLKSFWHDYKPRFIPNDISCIHNIKYYSKFLKKNKKYLEYWKYKIYYLVYKLKSKIFHYT